MNNDINATDSSPEWQIEELDEREAPMMKFEDMLISVGLGVLANFIYS